MSDNESIRIHPEYGLNAAMDYCFWCGEPRGVALFGACNQDMRYQRVYTSDEPCQACQEKMAQGLTIFAAELADGNQLRLLGPWAVITMPESQPEWFVHSAEKWAVVVKYKRLPITLEAFRAMFTPEEDNHDD